MPDVFSVAERSRIMSAVRSRGNRSTEIALATAFRSARIVGWRRHFPIIGRPDFAFPRARLAVFVDGCFWHGCERCGTTPASNRQYWQTKIERNVRRDLAQTKALRARGWAVVRVWEHELRGSAATNIAERIQNALARRHRVLPKLRGTSKTHTLDRGSKSR
jgi:DNA mismatch endonuclease (patch repair protein)